MEASEGEIVAARGRIEWTRRHMPVLVQIGEEFLRTRPFEGVTLGFRLHVEPKTAILLEVLEAGGARLVVLGNRGTTQFGTVAVLLDQGVEVLDEVGDDDLAVGQKLREIVSRRPQLLLDNGAELIREAVRNGSPTNILGATEETTSGAFSLREELEGEVPFPVVVINDSPLKSIVENKHGVGESVIDTISRVTNLSLHGVQVVVLGYGWCGRGIALYARRRGASVVVVEPDEIKALEAAMDGFGTAGLADAVPIAKLVVTATGRDGVLPLGLIRELPDGAILANAGHVEREIDVDGLREVAVARDLSPSVEAFSFEDGREVYLLAEGRIVNLASVGGLGNPIQAMDLGLALQARSLELLATAEGSLEHGAQAVPDTINRQVAAAVLASMQSGR